MLEILVPVPVAFVHITCVSKTMSFLQWIYSDAVVEAFTANRGGGHFHDWSVEHHSIRTATPKAIWNLVTSDKIYADSYIHEWIMDL